MYVFHFSCRSSFELFPIPPLVFPIFSLDLLMRHNRPRDAKPQKTHSIPTYSLTTNYESHGILFRFVKDPSLFGLWRATENEKNSREKSEENWVSCEGGGGCYRFWNSNNSGKRALTPLQQQRNFVRVKH
ncbi:hypothetical protein TNCT_377731 [Trichonephila clavata]|uniref:Uncharacterized protein n=1 Tax=Trichonephila clavata TaxID=2740835 RepID=A0A8X6IHG5_TRICU|nr:hypothetical protein TNCT_377731 [Trichonephila clavata]